MKTKTIVLAGSVILLGLLAFGLFATTSTAQAAPGQGPAAQRTPGPWRQTLTPLRETLAALPTPDGTILEDLLVREKLALSNQKTRLALSHTVAGTIQAYIDSQKSAGKDTSALESALSAFTQAISRAETDNAAAASRLAAPAGFDASGQVTDRAAARQTLRAAGRSLRQAHLTLTQATLNLRQAIRAYLGR